MKTKLNDYFIRLFLFICAAGLISRGGINEPVSGTTLSLQNQVAPLGADMLKAEVRLNQLFYDNSDEITAMVQVSDANWLNQENMAVVIATANTKDVEVLPLAPTGVKNIYATSGKIICKIGGTDGVKVNDGTLGGKPDEKFAAFFAYRDNESSKVVTDYGIYIDRQFKGSAVVIEPKIALTSDENKQPPNSRPVGTILVKNSLPVQLSTAEILISPTSEAQLKQFLAENKSKVIGNPQIYDSGKQKVAWYSVVANANTVSTDLLAQMRSFSGANETLYVSSPAAASICAQILYWQLEGYNVTFNTRLQYHGQPTTSDGSIGARIDVFSSNSADATTVIANQVFGLQKAWAFLALWDRDAVRIPVAFIDQGFAPNEDFRGHSADLLQPGIFQRDVHSGRVGPGAAVSPPTTPNSGVGRPSWHGSGVVSTAGALLNNGFGAAGTGGQVITPMLYRMDGFGSYAFEMGPAITFAVNDGASIINISAGFPCRAVSGIGGLGLDYCDPGGRQRLCSAISAIAHAAASAVCAAATAVPFIGPFIAPAICATVTGGATLITTVCHGTVLFGDIARFPLQLAIDNAVARGVTIVASSGNKIFNSLGELCNFIDCNNHDAGAWQVVPCVLPGVICAGASSETATGGIFQNIEFYGGRVDVWAPVNYQYFAPDQIERVVPSSQQIATSFGSSSGAAAYISGVIAMMQAINPALDPRTRTLSPDERMAIPGRIRELLRSTASTNGSTVISRDTPGSSLTVRLGPNLRNIVNVFDAVKRASTLGASASSFPLATFDSINSSVGFDEAGGSNDTPASATRVTRSGPLSFSGVILHIPGERPSGNPFIDRDHFKWVEDSAPGRYVGGEVRLQLPRRERFGDLRVNGQPGRFVSLDGEIETWAYEIPEHLHNVEVPFMIAGFHPTQDNIYRIAFVPPRRLDLFDPNGAISLGTGNLAWGTFLPEGLSQPNQRYNSVLNLTERTLAPGTIAHSYVISRLPAFTVPGVVVARSSRITLRSSNNFRAVVYDSAGRELRTTNRRSSPGITELDFEQFGTGVRIVVAADRTVSYPTTYSLNIKMTNHVCNLGRLCYSRR